MDKFGFAAVVLDSAIDKPLDYAIPESLQEKAKPGVRVMVPVRGHLRPGTIYFLKEKAEIAAVQPIAEISSEKPLISEDLFALANWISKYYCAPMRRVIKLMLPPSVRKGMEAKRQLFVKPLLSRPQMAELCKKSPSQAAVLEVLLMHPKGILLTELLEKAGVSRSPVQSLVKENVVLLEPLEIDRSPVADQEFFPTKAKILSSEQGTALSRVTDSLKAGRFETHLIHGVTGSGKTEIYLQAIDHALSQGKGALMLVPEIALTTQTIERMRSRFQQRIAIIHHRLSDGERRDTWHKIHQGEIQIVLGARSALFSPICNLGLIIVDEEHEPSYKQSEEAPCYHARDVAVMRGKLLNATVILGSATPSLESYYNAKNGKYTLSHLSLRVDHALLPEVKVVDKGPKLFTDVLLNEIDQRLKLGEQSLLFLNRRGYHTAQVCVQCARVLECPHCAVSLTFHKGENNLACHLCNYELSPPPKNCPHCKTEDAFKYKGAGTEQVERSLHAIFPKVRTLRLDADTTRHKGSHEKLFKQFRAGKADVLIGTQMIAKGLHFPSVTLVGVLNADASLHIPDFRAAEHVFQLLTQVSGRSGRGALKGKVIIQTRMADNPVIMHAASQDYEAFYREEIESRKLFGYPPFSHLVKLTFSGPSAPKILETAQGIRHLLVQHLPPTFQIHPVIPCGYAKIKDKFRFQLLIRGETVRPVTEILEKLERLPMTIDVDPLSTYF